MPLKTVIKISLITTYPKCWTKWRAILLSTRKLNLWINLSRRHFLLAVVFHKSWNQNPLHQMKTRHKRRMKIIEKEYLALMQSLRPSRSLVTQVLSNLLSKRWQTTLLVYLRFQWAHVTWQLNQVNFQVQIPAAAFLI